MKVEHFLGKTGIQEYALVQDDSAYVVWFGKAEWHGKPDLVLLKKVAGDTAKFCGTPIGDPVIDKSSFAPAGSTDFFYGTNDPNARMGSCCSYQDSHGVACFIYV